MVHCTTVKEKDKRESEPERKQEKEIPVTKPSVRWDVITVDGTAAIDTR